MTGEGVVKHRFFLAVLIILFLFSALMVFGSDPICSGNNAISTKSGYSSIGFMKEDDPRYEDKGSNSAAEVEYEDDYEEEDEDSISQAIVRCRKELNSGAIEEGTEEYADKQNEWGYLFYKLSFFTWDVDNILAALYLYDRAATIFKSKNTLLKLAEVKYRKGLAYIKYGLVTKDPFLLEEAESAFNESLKIYTKDRYPLDYARVQIELSKIFLGRSEVRDYKANVKKSIELAEAALKINTEHGEKDEIQKAKHAIAKGYVRLSKLTGRADDVKKGIDIFKEISGYYELKGYQKERIESLNGLGLALYQLYRITKREEYIRQSIDSYEKALKSFEENKNYHNYSRVFSNLGIAYMILAHRTDKREHVEAALNNFKHALKTYRGSKDKMRYAYLFDNLGSAYYDLGIYFDSIKDLNEAINCYKKSLQVKSYREDSISNATAKSAIGTAYIKLGQMKKENRRSNLKKGIEYCKEALKIFRENDYPLDYGTIERLIKGAELLMIFSSD